MRKQCVMNAVKADVHGTPHVTRPSGAVCHYFAVTEPSAVPWWVDAAISTAEEDVLDRAIFAERVSAILGEVGSQPDSTVLGLIGPWGSGKSSTLALLETFLDDDIWTVKRINPWALTDPVAVVREVFDALQEAFAGEQHTHIRDAIAKYGQRAAPLLKFLPMVGDAAAAAMELIASAAESPPATLEVQAAGLEKLLRAAERRVLVVLDDVDRLHADELLALFKAVRVLGRLANVHYVLAYDEQTLLDVLTGTDIARGNRARALAFLDKIVTLRLDQPPTQLRHSRDLLDRGLTMLLTDLGIHLEEHDDRLEAEKAFLLRHGLTEPRTVRRFLTQLRIYLPLVDATEIDIADFGLLSWFRIALPDLYRQLSADADWLSQAESVNAEDEAALRRWTTETGRAQLGISEEADPDLFAAALRLFPRINGEPDRQEIARRSHDLRVSDPDYTRRYFALNPLVNTISDAALRQAFTEWIAGEPADAVRKLIFALVPDNDTATADAIGLLRRARTLSTKLSPEEASTLLIPVFELAASMTDGAREAPSLEPTIQWFAALLSYANGPKPAILLDRIGMSSTRMEVLIRALVETVPISHGSFVNSNGLGVRDTEWMASLLDASCEAAWTAFLGHVQSGERAVDLGAPLRLLTWVQDQVGYTEVTERLRRVVDELEVDLAALAARFVRSTTTPSGYQTLVGFDDMEFVERLGRQRIEGRRDSLELALALHENPSDDDAGWPARTAIASRRLLDLLDGQSTPTLLALREPPTMTANAMRNRPVEMSWNASQPDLLIRVTIGLPLLMGHAPTAVAVRGLSADARSGIYSRLAEALPIAATEDTLAAAIQRVPDASRSWKLEESQQAWMRASRLVLGLLPQAATTGQRDEYAVAIEAHLNLAAESPGGPTEVPAVLLTIGVGLWAPARTGEERRGKISCAAVIQAVAELLKCAVVAETAQRELTESEPSDRDDVAVLVGFRAPQVETILELDSTDRIGTSTANGWGFATMAPIRTLQGLTGGRLPRQIAASALNEWLSSSGFRRTETQLAALAAIELDS